MPKNGKTDFFCYISSSLKREKKLVEWNKHDERSDKS